MDLKKAQASLEKLNVLFNSIQNSKEDISSIEKDLLLSYIRKLYDAVLQEAHPSSKVKNVLTKKPAKKKPKKKKIVRAAVSNDSNIKNKVESDIVDQKEKNEPVAIISEEKPIAKEEVTDPVHENLKELFNIQEAKELSEKLSQMPIKDLTKSMGINERVFTVQELFGGNQELFNSCITTLNGYNNFDDAKQFLIAGVAKDHDWSQEDKLKKAAHFIKLVHRRYQ